MKQAIRALAIATLILWILLIAFAITAVYSVMNLGIDFGESQFFSSNGDVVLSLPFFINNRGYYDISELNVTTHVKNYNGTLLVLSETFVPLIASGSNVETAHNISIALPDILSMGYAEFLFNDSYFELDAFVALNFAHAIPVQISMNLTIPWGAPLSNLSIEYVPPENNTLVIPISFENHSFFDIVGTMQLEVYNDMNELVTSEQRSLNVFSYGEYDEPVEIYLSIGDLSKLTGSGNFRLVFDVPMFTVERWIPYG